MEQQKKRHNPEITQEDLAVKAFDRLENIVQEAKNSSQNVEAVKTDNALVKDFYNLLSKVFGEELVKENEGDLNMLCSKEELYSGLKGIPEQVDFEKNLEDPFFVNLMNDPHCLVEKKGKWYQRKKFEKYITLEINIPEQVIKSDAGELPKLKFIVENGKYNPVKVTAHTQEALRKAKVFVKAYEALTGKKATLIQDCEDEEPIKEVQKEIQSLDQKVKEPSKQVKIVKEMGSTSGKILKEIGKGAWKGTKWSLTNILLPPFIMSTIIRRHYEGDESNLRGDLLASGAEAMWWPPTNLFSIVILPTVSIISAANGRWEFPAIYFGANAASGLYELYRHSRNKVEEEEKWKR